MRGCLVQKVVFSEKCNLSKKSFFPCCIYRLAGLVYLYCLFVLYYCQDSKFLSGADGVTAIVLVLKIHSAAGNFYHETSNLTILTNWSYGLFSLGCLAFIRYLNKNIYIYIMKIGSKYTFDYFFIINVIIDYWRWVNAIKC